MKEHASQELAHALEVAKQIDYLGGDPTVKSEDAEYSQDSKTMLEIDLEAGTSRRSRIIEKGFVRLNVLVNLLYLRH